MNHFRSPTDNRFIRRVLLTLAICAACGATPLAAQEIEPDFQMLTDPEFDIPRSKTFLAEGAIELWRQSLSRPEPDILKAAAESIATAHTEGFPGLDVCRPGLIEALASPDLHPEVIDRLCRALIALDVRESADKLFEISQQRGTAFRQFIEPVLAEWNYAPIQEVWRDRLANEDTNRRELLFACQGAAEIGDQSAVPLLMEIVLARTRPSDIRLTAARAVGQLVDSGREQDAASLSGHPSKQLIDDLCAVALLKQHSSEEAQQQLLAFAAHDNPTVAAPALRRLWEIDPELVLPLAAKALENADPKVRQCGLDTYISLPTVDRITLIADALDDPHPDLRTSARKAMHRFSDEDRFLEVVLESSMEVLSRDGWRGQEQAGLLLIALDHKPAAPRLAELLDSERSEVRIASAWGLRKLAVPETLDPILDKAVRETDYVYSLPEGTWRRGTDHLLGHLFEALAVMGDERAMPVMRRHIPKDLTRPYSRSAAIWGLGVLLIDQPDEKLARQLLARVMDVKELPELAMVRRMSAVSIGRMNATSQAEGLQMMCYPYVFADSVSYAMEWALQRMNIETPERAPPPDNLRVNWLLEPIVPREDDDGQ